MTNYSSPTSSSDDHDDHASIFDIIAQESTSDTVSSPEDIDIEPKVDWDLEVALCDLYYETARMYERRGDIQTSAWYYLETLKRSQWIWGDDHPKTLADKHNLGWIYARIPELMDVGWQLMVDVLQRKMRIWGVNHPRTLKTMFNMACISWYCGHGQVALDWHRGILEKRRLALGDQHDDTKLSIRWLQYMYV
jgi:hypothetical protein